MLDPKRPDVVLVGTRARHPETRVDIDSLIVGLHAVWAQGHTPLVSLDPLPDDPGGPQYSRVHGVPQNSSFARIMLDADYAMKRVLHGDLKPRIPGFQSLADLLARRPPSPSLAVYRSWFVPVPLGPRTLHVSATDRTMLFTSRLNLLTESETAGVAEIMGAGQHDDPMRDAILSFNAHYPTLEASTEVRPSQIFLRLHGLADIVTVCKLLRKLEVRYRLLEEFARLPVRAVDVPAYYPTTVVEYARDTRGRYVIKGGVKFRTRTSRQSLDRYQDSTTRALEHVVDTFPRDQVFAKEVPLDLAVPAARPDGSSSIEQRLNAAITAIQGGTFSRARDLLRDILREDPGYATAWETLALAELGLGQPQAAGRAIQKALELEPLEEEFKLTALFVLLQSGTSVDLSTWSDQLRQDLSDSLAQLALQGLVRGPIEASRRIAEMAVRVWDENPDAFYVRAVTRSALTKEWQRDLDLAIRLYRRTLPGPASTRAKDRLALALAYRARSRLAEYARIDLDRARQDPVALRAALNLLTEATQDADAAQQLNDNLPLAPTLKAGFLARRAELLRHTGSAADIRPARTLVETVVRRFPDYAPGHREHAMILAMEQQLEPAIRALSEAIRIDPTLHGALAERAALNAMAGKCAAARDDVKRSAELRLPVPPPIARLVGDCR